MTIKQDAIGISLKPQFYHELQTQSWNIDFLEGHIENFLQGGFHLHHLQQLSNHYPISLHGVGLSLGGSEAPLSQDMTERKKIIDAIQPAFFSEHAAWTRFGNAHQHDLLPLPLTISTAKKVAENVTLLQDYLKREILLENLSAYTTFEEDVLSEAEFMNEISKRSGCKMLLDINNIFVQEHNLGRSAKQYLKTIHKDYVAEYHLAGGEFFDNTSLIADTHGTPIPEAVMDLYGEALKIIGLRPTLYERDNNIPSLKEMEQEVIKIKQKQTVTVENA